MYTKKILSAAAAVAVMSTGAMAFDFTTAGTIVDDITEVNASMRTASYINGVDANETMTLSTNSKGDALIYPAFKTDGWNSELVVRNSINKAVVAKVVLYAEDNSRELVDFDIYLSPYDVFRFQINSDRTVTTDDGSFALVDPSLATDDKRFITEKTTITTLADNISGGYAVIYGMTEAQDAGVYDGEHGNLFRDFRRLVDTCRDDDNLTSNTDTWRAVLGNNSADISNGTAVSTDRNVTAPSVLVGATDLTSCYGLRMLSNVNGDFNASIDAMDSNFTSVSSDALFGDVRISHDGDKRDLLIKATAIDNYTAANQMMLWVPGEYASIQDRRMMDTDADIISEYNLTGIIADAATFITKTAYYTFDDNEMNGANSVLVTQPMKRALVMGGDTQNYWKAGGTGKSATANRWGEFSVSAAYRDEDENLDTAATTLGVVVSPVSGDPADAYNNELQVFNDPERTETSAASGFKTSTLNGFAIMTLGTTKGLPAIVTQMSGSMVDGEAQINWIYSTTDKD